MFKGELATPNVRDHEGEIVLTWSDVAGNVITASVIGSLFGSTALYMYTQQGQKVGARTLELGFAFYLISAIAIFLLYGAVASLMKIGRAD